MRNDHGWCASQALPIVAPRHCSTGGNVGNYGHPWLAALASRNYGQKLLLLVVQAHYTPLLKHTQSITHSTYPFSRNELHNRAIQQHIVDILPINLDLPAANPF